MTTDYNKLKVAELRDLLKDRAIPSTGLSRKQQIIDALEAADAEGSGVPGKSKDAAEVDGEASGDSEQVEGLALPETAGEVADESEPVKENVLPEVVKVAAENATVWPAAEAATPPAGPSTPNDTVTSETRKRKRDTPDEETAPEDDGKTKKLKPDNDDTPATKTVAASAPLGVDGAADDRVNGEINVYDDTSMNDAPAPTVHGSEDLVSPALHLATRALYIRNLIRPLQQPQLREHLLSLADASADCIETFHIDPLRSHAFVVFNSIQVASRVRSSLHDSVWPPEPTRKPLWVDFVPEEKVGAWVEMEGGDGRGAGRGSDAKRWEVVYSDPANGEVTAELQEVSSQHGNGSSAPSGPAAATASSGGLGMPNAPSGPRGDSRRHDADEPPSRTQAEPASESRPIKSEPRSPTADAAPSSSDTFKSLDERFRSTTCKPKIYFLPVAPAIAEERLRELKARTARDWDGGSRAEFAPGAPLRRYTFEEGGKVVDGGPDKGDFGLVSHSGGRGRGGYRGGRGGYGGGRGGGYGGGYGGGGGGYGGGNYGGGGGVYGGGGGYRGGYGR